MIVWRGKRDIDAMFEAYPAFTAHEHGTSYVPIRDEKSLDRDFGIGCVTHKN